MEAATHTSNLAQIQRKLTAIIECAQETQARYYNKHHAPVEFEVCDMALLRTTNVRTRRPSRKLDDRYLGPLKITKRIGNQAYRLELPDS